MSDISRRDIMTLAGAGLALSACDWKGGKGSARSDKGGPGGADHARKAMAPCDPFGYPANTLPDDASYFPVKFEAPYICVIHIDFSKAWTLAVNYASFAIDSKSDDKERLEKAKAVLNERFDLQKPVDSFSKLTKNPTYGNTDYHDFSKFGFKSKHELFFFFDSNLVVLNPDFLVVFTKLSMNHPKIPNNENYSFINASVVSKDDMGSLYDRGRMIRMRNYVQDEGGQPIDWNKGESRHYSMNLHFQVPCGTNQWVPMVIDPDTGNGNGNEP
jgi:hypothetical protein